MIWLWAVFLIAVPAGILVMLTRDERRAEQARPPMGWVHRFWHGSVVNRRRHPRYRASIPLTYRVVAIPPAVPPADTHPTEPPAAPAGPDGSGADGTTRDLSVGGAGILVAEKLRPGTDVELRLQGPPPGGVVLVRGLVRWVRELPQSPADPRRRFWAGLQLVAPTAIAQAQLQAILERLARGDGQTPDA